MLGDADGAALGAFSAGLLNMYRKTPGMTVDGIRPTQEGTEIEVTGSGGDIQVNETVKVVCGGIQAQNARIYIVDAVLNPADAPAPITPTSTSGTSTTTTTTTTTPSTPLPAEVPVFPMGVGSNLIVRDGGIRGVVIRLGRGFNDVTIEGDRVTAGAAALDAHDGARATWESWPPSLRMMRGVRAGERASVFRCSHQ